MSLKLVCARQKNSLSRGEAVKFVSGMPANVQCGSLVATCQPRERCLTIAVLQYLQRELVLFAVTLARPRDLRCRPKEQRNNLPKSRISYPTLPQRRGQACALGRLM